MGFKKVVFQLIAAMLVVPSSILLTLSLGIIFFDLHPKGYTDWIIPDLIYIAAIILGIYVFKKFPEAQMSRTASGFLCVMSAISLLLVAAVSLPNYTLFKVQGYPLFGIIFLISICIFVIGILQIYSGSKPERHSKVRALIDHLLRIKFRIVLITTVVFICFISLFALKEKHPYYFNGGIVYLFKDRDRQTHLMSEADFKAVLEYRKPIYAEPAFFYADGGTVVYKGYGYLIEVQKRLESENGIDGFIYGPRIIYNKTDEKGIPLEKSDQKFYPTNELQKLLESNGE